MKEEEEARMKRRKGRIGRGGGTKKNENRENKKRVFYFSDVTLRYSECQQIQLKEGMR